MIKKLVSENKTKVLLLIISLGISLCFLELTNYLITINNNHYYVWPPNLKNIFLPNSSIMHGVYGNSVFTINELGYRGPLIKNKGEGYRILVVGGSTSECLYLDDSEEWPHLVMEKLNETNDGRKVIVMNIGKSGHNLRNHILELKYLIKDYNPDLIISMVGVNDMLLKLSKRWVWKPFDENSYDYTKTFYIYQKYSPKSSFTYKIFKFIYTKFYTKLEPQDTVGDTILQKRIERKNTGITLSSTPDLSIPIENYGTNLNRLIEIAEENNVKILFSTQPYL